MKNTRIAQTYGKALFDFAHENQIVEEVNQDMKLVSTVIEENRDLRLLLKSPIVRLDKKVAVINGIFKKHICETSLRYLQIITKKGRDKFILDIAKRYGYLYKEFMGIIPAKLITAGDIDGKIKESVLKSLRELTNAKIELTEEIDKDLIGGFILKFDDKQYDASLLKQIKLLQREFDENIYIKGY